MAKFCKKCGARLDESTGICLNCNKLEVPVRPVERRNTSKVIPPQVKKPSTNDVKVENKNTKSKKSAHPAQQKHTRFIVKLIAIILALVIAISGCTCALVYFDVVKIPFVSEFIFKLTKNKEAKAIEDAFENDDVEKINLLIFGDNTIEIDEETSIQLGEEKPFNTNGFISHILRMTDVSVVKMDDTTVTYKVIAPDMKGVFDESLSIQTQNEMMQQIILHADGAKKIEKEVTVSYAVVDNKMEINYQAKEFIDAILGGIISEYNALYEKALDEIADEEF